MATVGRREASGSDQGRFWASGRSEAEVARLPRQSWPERLFYPLFHSPYEISLSDLAKRIVNFLLAAIRTTASRCAIPEKPMTRWILLAAMLALASSCVTAKYGRFDPDRICRGGYSEHKLSEDIYEVRYAAACWRAPKGEPRRHHYPEDWRLLRCAELTLENGYQYFLVEGGITPSHYSRPDTYVIKMFSTKPDVDLLLFVYHAETVQQQMRTRYKITAH